jgi:hypothetical protein
MSRAVTWLAFLVMENISLKNGWKRIHLYQELDRNDYIYKGSSRQTASYPGKKITHIRSTTPMATC